MSARKTYGLQALLDYLKGKGSSQNRHELERELEADPFEREALEGLESIGADQAEQDLLALHDRLRKRLSRKRRISWYAAAASVASLLILGTLFLQIYDFSGSREEDLVEEMPHLVEPSQKAAPETLRDEAEVETPEKAEVAVPVPQESSTQESSLQERQAQTSTDMVVEEAEAQPVAVPLETAQPENAQPEAARAAAPPLQAAVAMEEAPLEAAQEAADDAAKDAPEDAPEDAPVERAKRKGRHSVQAVPVSTAEIGDPSIGLEEVSTRVSGKVISAEDMEPLPGVSLSVRGANTGGTVSDLEGNFTLEVGKEEEMTLVASFIGMESEEKEVRGGQEVEIVLEPSQMSLDEVVVVHTSSTAMQEQDSQDASAQPAEGYKAFRKYMEEHIRRPEAQGDQKEIVVLRFQVEPDGSLTHMEVLRSPGEDFSREAMRLLNEGPDWKAATGKMGPYPSTVRMRITFK